jgi:hypothetical protein
MAIDRTKDPLFQRPWPDVQEPAAKWTASKKANDPDEEEYKGFDPSDTYKMDLLGGSVGNAMDTQEQKDGASDDENKLPGEKIFSDPNFPMQVKAPSSGWRMPDVMSDANGHGAPSFRDQTNARDEKHAAETAEIEKLMSAFDDAQKADMRHAGRERVHQLGILAGGAASSGIAHLAPPQMPDVKFPSQVDALYKKAKTKDDLQNSLFKRENPQLERDAKLNMLDMKNIHDDYEKAVKADADRKKFDDAELGRNTRAGNHESEENKRTESRNVNGIDVAIIGQNGNVGRGVAEKAASAEYEQAKFGSKRTYDGMKYHAKGMVDNNQSNRADHVLETYAMIMPTLDRLEHLMDTNPRAYGQWGEDARAELISNIQDAAEATTKYQGDGVMNAQDRPNAMKELGSPESFENFLTSNGGAGLKSFKKSIQERVDTRLRSLNYDPGEGSVDNSLEGTHKRAAAAGQAAGGGYGPRVEVQDAIDAQHEALHGKKPTIKPNPPAQKSSEDLNNPPPENKRGGNAGKRIIWEPGKKARIE